MKDYQKELPTVGYEFLRYLTIEKGLSEKTIYEYFLDLRIFFRYMVARKKGALDGVDGIEKTDISTVTLSFVAEIQRGDISGYISWLGMEMCQKDVTRRRKIATLKSFYGYLITMGLIEHNVMNQILSPKIKKSLPKYLEAPEVETLLQAINGAFWIRDVAIILMMTSSGLRVSEIVALNLVDVYEDSVRVLGKGNKERIVYLSERTQEGLKDYLSIRGEWEETAVFLSKYGKRMGVRGVQKMTKKYLVEIEKGDLSCHKLRHTAATQMLRSGGNLREIQMVLGHENISTTEIYIHVRNSDLADLAKGLEI